MDRFIPLIVWAIGAAICAYIAKRRNVKAGLFWTLIVVFLGPFAIPLIFLAKPEAAGS